MTTTANAHTQIQPSVPFPTPQSPVLSTRALRPGTDPTAISRFADSRWELAPAIHEAHYSSVSVNFALVPPDFRHAAKIYVWMELNTDREAFGLRRSGVEGPTAVYSMHYRILFIRRFLEWLTINAIRSLGDVTAGDLDRYLQSVLTEQDDVRRQGHLLNGVRRLWAFRDLLPPQDRLPEAPPWKGKDNRVLLGRARPGIENRTRRIPETTMSALLCWALRFVEDFSADITAAWSEYRVLVGRTEQRTSLADAAQTTVAAEKRAWMTAAIDTVLEYHRVSGEALPGRMIGPTSSDVEPDWMHLARLIGCSHAVFARRQGRYRQQVLDSGLPIAEGTYLQGRPRGLLDGSPWLHRIQYDQVPQLVRALHTAAYIVIAYLSGMRPGEVLTLERGCAATDSGTGLRQITGREWKAVTDAAGVKIPQGRLRSDPWIVIEPVTRAVSVLERLHHERLLFPVSIVGAKGTDRPGGAKASATIANDMNFFVGWVKDYCAAHDRLDSIPVPDFRLNGSQLRRTLAWFICRRPRGLVAAAIQYGHVHVQITQGYGGNYASGFPDEMAFEQWLARLDELDTADRALKAGSHVSGPAADAYRDRVAGGSDRFAGRVVRSSKQARHILANPSLQIYPGRGMTCVFDAASALCDASPSVDDARTTPDIDDCRSSCRNIARTDDDITDIEREAAELRSIIDDSASPPLRLEREKRRLAYLDKIIDAHTATRTTPRSQR